MATLLGIDETIDAIRECVCISLEDAERPVCECYTTIGEPVIGTCCECRKGVSGELVANLQATFRLDRRTLQQGQPGRSCAGALWGARFQLTLARCFPTLDEHGELPSTSALEEAAARLHADAALIQRAVTCCGDVDDAIVESVQVQRDPEGGCSTLVATILAPVSMTAARNPG